MKKIIVLFLISISCFGANNNEKIEKSILKEIKVSDLISDGITTFKIIEIPVKVEVPEYKKTIVDIPEINKEEVEKQIKEIVINVLNSIDLESYIKLKIDASTENLKIQNAVVQNVNVRNAIIEDYVIQRPVFKDIEIDKPVLREKVYLLKKLLDESGKDLLK